MKIYILHIQYIHFFKLFSCFACKALLSIIVNTYPFYSFFFEVWLKIFSKDQPQTINGFYTVVAKMIRTVSMFKRFQFFFFLIGHCNTYKTNYCRNYQRWKTLLDRLKMMGRSLNLTLIEQIWGELENKLDRSIVHSKESLLLKLLQY